MIRGPGVRGKGKSLDQLRSNHFLKLKGGRAHESTLGNYAQVIRMSHRKRPFFPGQNKWPFHMARFSYKVCVSLACPLWVSSSGPVGVGGQTGLSGSHADLFQYILFPHRILVLHNNFTRKN